MGAGPGPQCLRPADRAVCRPERVGPVILRGGRGLASCGRRPHVARMIAAVDLAGKAVELILQMLLAQSAFKCLLLEDRDLGRLLVESLLGRVESGLVVLDDLAPVA